MNVRVDHLLEVARLAGKLLLSYAVAAWTLYLLVGLALPSHVGAGSPWPLVIAMVLALPAPMLLSQRRGSRNPLALQGAWEQIDHRDPARLADFHRRLQRQTGLRAAARASWEERLLEAWHESVAMPEGESAACLCDLLFACSRFGPRERELLLRLPSGVLNPWEHARLWARALADGLEPDAAALAEILARLRGGKPSRKVRALRALLFRLARDGQEDAKALLREGLMAQRLRPSDLPPDLAHLAPQGAGRTHAAVARVGNVRVRVDEARAALAGKAGLLGQGRWKWIVLACAAVLALLISRGLRSRPAEPPAPPVSPLTYAPPANAAGGFTLQIMSSRDSVRTVRYVERLHADSLYAYVLAPRRNSSWLRVRLGWFAERAAADSVAGLLKGRGRIDEWYVANFDLEDRLHERAEAPRDTTAGDSVKTGARSRPIRRTR